MPEPTRAPRWMKIALALSLGVNLVVAGAIVGARTAAPPPEVRAQAQGGPSMRGGPLTRALSSDDRRALRQELRQTQATEGHLRDMRAAQEGIVAAVRAEPFSSAALAAALAQHQQITQRLGAVAQTALIDRIAAMSPAQRAEFADRFEEQAQRGPRRKRP